MPNGGPLSRPFHAVFIIISDTFCTNQYDLSGLATESSQLINVLAVHKLHILQPVMPGLMLQHWQMS